MNSSWSKSKYSNWHDKLDTLIKKLSNNEFIMEQEYKDVTLVMIRVFMYFLPTDTDHGFSLLLTNL
jgi:hypothetical protein